MIFKHALFFFSHKQFRAMLKKLRRKKIRQKRAKEREQLELLGNIFVQCIITYYEKRSYLMCADLICINFTNFINFVIYCLLSKFFRATEEGKLTWL